MEWAQTCRRKSRSGRSGPTNGSKPSAVTRAEDQLASVGFGDAGEFAINEIAQGQIACHVQGI